MKVNLVNLVHKRSRFKNRSFKPNNNIVIFKDSLTNMLKHGKMKQIHIFNSSNNNFKLNTLLYSFATKIKAGL